MGYLDEIDAQDPSVVGDGSPESAIDVERPSVFHEGAGIAIKVHRDIEPSAFVLPLRNGFPFKVEGRSTPVSQLLSENGLRMGHVLWLEDIGLYAAFDKPVPSGLYHVT